MYQGDFENRFLDETKSYYQKIVDRENFGGESLSSYLSYVIQTLEVEEKRVYECLDVSTHEKLITIVEDLLIT